MLDGIRTYISEEWAVVRQAPAAFLVTLGLGIAVAGWFYNERIATLEEHLEFAESRAGSAAIGQTILMQPHNAFGAGTLFVSPLGAISSREEHVETRFKYGAAFTDMTCLNTGDHGSGDGTDVHITGRTGPCGSLADSTFQCHLKAGVAPTRCEASGSFDIEAGHCASFRVDAEESVRHVFLSCTLAHEIGRI